VDIISASCLFVGFGILIQKSKKYIEINLTVTTVIKKRTRRKFMFEK